MVGLLYILCPLIFLCDFQVEGEYWRHRAASAGKELSTSDNVIPNYYTGTVERKTYSSRPTALPYYISTPYHGYHYFWVKTLETSPPSPVAASMYSDGTVQEWSVDPGKWSKSPGSILHFFTPHYCALMHVYL